MRASSSQARARPLPSWGCWSSPYRSSMRMTRTPQLGSCELCWPGARLLPGRHLHRLDRGPDRGLSRLRAIKPRNGNRRPAGHQTADTEGKAGRKFLPQFPKQKSEYRLRVDFGGGLLSAARPRRSGPGEHPEWRAATCFGPRHCGFVLQRPWPGMGGHGDIPAGIRSRLGTGIGDGHSRRGPECDGWRNHHKRAPVRAHSRRARGRGATAGHVVSAGPACRGGGRNPPARRTWCRGSHRCQAPRAGRSPAPPRRRAAARPASRRNRTW